MADAKYSTREPCFHALGNTDEGRLLHITSTMRGVGQKILVISACDMHRMEREFYDQAS